MSTSRQQYSISQVKGAHKDLMAVEDALNSGDFERAQSECEYLLESYPDYFGALRSLGKIQMKRGVYSAALPHLVRAALISPDDWETLTNLGKAQLEINAEKTAIDSLERACQIAPGRSTSQLFLGEAFSRDGNHSRALRAFETASELDASDPNAQIQLVTIYVRLGRYPDAEKVAACALSMPLTREQRMVVCFTLSVMPHLPDDTDLLALLDELGNGDDANTNRAMLHYARAATLHKLGRHDEAWTCWNDINREIAEKATQARETYLMQGEDLLHSVTRWRRPAPRKSRGSKTPVSLFILGPSRSGKSTLEQLVASSDGVMTGLENNIVRNTARRVSQKAGLLTEDLLANISDDKATLIETTYHQQLTAVAESARLLTITHPSVIYDVGYLAECVPDARFAFMRRDQDDTVFRIYTRLYRPGSNQFAYDLSDIREYLAQYNKMVDAWISKLGERAIVISYEDMAVNPLDALNKIAALCGLQTGNEAPEIADDRGCAKPYRSHLS